MYQDHTPLQMAGQLLLAFAFLATGIRNAGWKLKQHLERMAANGVPRAKTVLIAGFVLQFTGALFLASDLYREVGAALLIAFTVFASAIFHRWWSMPDPLLRHLHLSNLIVNCGIVGGLLLVASIP
jgi:putative oxidoreductase